jgi:hypothetical protein
MKHRHSARVIGVLAATTVAAGVLLAHDLFLKLDSYFLPPQTAVRALLLNGTFIKSEGVVARDRIADLALVGPSGRSRLDTLALTATHDTSEVRLRTGAAGTYILGLSVRPREISLTGDQFNGYLREEGIDEMLAERTKTGTLGESARERYAKHVKAIFQVGTKRSESYSTVLGYDAEIVPLENPYRLKRGATLRVRCLVKGQPVAGLTVLAGGITPAGALMTEARSVSDSAGIAIIRLAQAGRWYAKFIRMQHSSEPGITHESQWATLTFELR